MTPSAPSRGKAASAKPRTALTAHDRLDITLDVLAAVSSAPGQTIRMDDLASELSVTEQKLEEVVALIQSLADRETGARIILTCKDGHLSLEGDAGAIAPIRLSPDESAAVHHVLARHQLAPDVRSRIESTLMADGQTAAEDAAPMSTDPLFGGFYQVITEALQDGTPLAISYCSRHDACARERIVDPGYIELDNNAAYLIAWDTGADEQRRYRLDRIADAYITEGSVTHHPFQRETIHDSLQHTGKTATVRFQNRGAAENFGWAGIDFAHGHEREDGTFEVPVYYSDNHWLLDRILAAGGRITLIEPAELIEALHRRGLDLLDAIA